MKNGFETRVVKKVLHLLKLSRSGRQGSDGHELWVNENGARVRPAFRKKHYPMGQIYCLGLQLEASGIVTRQHFVNLLRKFASA